MSDRTKQEAPRPVRFQDIFDDPDLVGESEYRMMYEHASSVAGADVNCGLVTDVNTEHVLSVAVIDELLGTFQHTAETAVAILGILQQKRKDAEAFEQRVLTQRQSA